MAVFRVSLTLLILVLFLGCNKTPEKGLIDLLENYYANLYVNEDHKREVLRELEEFFEKNELTEDNVEEIKKIIHNFQDAHVELYHQDHLTRLEYLSGLEFHAGSDFVKSCSECEPTIPPGKYKILKINGVKLRDFLLQKNNSITASTPWGKDYRILRMLTQSLDSAQIEIKLLNHRNEATKTRLIWKEKERGIRQCVTGERINENIFKLNILSLWCDDQRNLSETRKEVLNRFKNQFDEIASLINENDFIILDLRENGGGSDLEVEYVLNTFSQTPLFMYKYQYLITNYQSRKNWLKNFLSFNAPLWDDIDYLYSNPSKPTKYRLYQNKIVTLISPGCFSSCEGLASSLKSDRSVLVGNTTHGGAGDPVAMPIKGTPYLINIPTCLAWQKDGKLFEGQGVLADREISQDFSDEKDSVLHFVIKNYKSFNL